MVAISPADEPAPRTGGKVSADQAGARRFIESHCLDCHDRASKTAGLALDELIATQIDQNADAWERVVRKLAERQMPPKKEPRPAEPDYDAVTTWLATSLDAAAAKQVNPGRTETFRRLTRTEYQNTIRDLLALDIDCSSLLPSDESSHGFDNITISDLSPSLLSRYVAAAQKISRPAVGRATASKPSVPPEETFRVRPDITQDTHIAGLPIGTRGGTLISYNFPTSGEYEIQVHLMRDRNEELEGLREAHELEIMLDRERVGQFTVKPPPSGTNDKSVDANLTTRVTVAAGPHKVGAAFLANSSSLLETTRQPLNVHFNFYRHPRIGPAVYQVTIRGPIGENAAGDTPSRRRIFTSRPTDESGEDECAEQILSTLLRRAYRRPVDADDLRVPLAFYRQGRTEGDFEAGIESALAAVLVQPHFLFRIERERADVSPGAAYRISDVELASRLSYFLWSSMPDDELLDLAAQGQLSRPDVLEKQVRRMLADKRSRALVSNFAGQWLYLRNLEAVFPDMRLYPDFDDNLRQAFRQETELFVEEILREDQSVLALIKSDHTYLNERLAKHYGIKHVHGSRFRRVSLPGDSLAESSQRGGLLRHGSILSVTSYATRTSPVIRGQWVLSNLLGSPPPPPPPDVPALADNTVSSTLSVRERLAQHRANAACASCHELMDPVGFSLENFDAIGRWRNVEAGQPIDSAGGLPDGREFAGVSGLEQALHARPELFARTLAEKLLTYALGRGVETFDAPAVRQIVKDAKDDNYRFSRLILGIVQSTPFQMRRAQ
jgi:hypothetical protein